MPPDAPLKSSPPKSVLETALAAAAAGFSVLPIKTDGSKAPALEKWEQFQQERATEQQIRGWFPPGTSRGLGVVMGPVSGNAEMFEFEGRAVEAGIRDEFRQEADQMGLGDVVTRIEQGWLDESPSGGVHLHYRCPEGVDGDTVLAKNAGGKLLIETRGDGGQTVTAPSNGKVHPTGKPWKRIAGGPDTIATISGEERAALFALARSFDQMPPVVDNPSPPRNTTAAPSGDLRPGEDFNARANWADILVGWTYLFSTRDGRQHWRRPGKPIGTSATISANGEVLVVFSTSVAPLIAWSRDNRKGYSKFSAYVTLEHGGDPSAAAKALAALGYGEKNGVIRHGGADAPAAATLAPDEPFTMTAREFASRVPEEVEWVLSPYIARGDRVELDALVKSGKSTLTWGLIKAMETGADYLGGSTIQGHVVVLTEMAGSSLREQLEAADLLDSTHLHLVLYHDHYGKTWAEVVALATAACLEFDAPLLVIDTVAKWSKIRGDEGNSDGPWLERMELLEPLHGGRTAVLHLHHDRKSGGDVGQSGAGNAARAGTMDTILRMSRIDGSTDSRQRKLEATGRHPDTPELRIISLTPEGYIALGDKPSAVVDWIGNHVRDLLANDEPWTVPGLTAAIIDRAEGQGPAPKRTTIQRALEWLIDHRMARRDLHPGAATTYSRVSVRVGDRGVETPEPPRSLRAQTYDRTYAEREVPK